MNGYARMLASRLPAGAALAAALLLAACADITSRRETIGFAAGDAVAANKALQVIDPWDSRAAWTDIDQDGNRAVAAVDNYRTGGESSESEAGTQIVNGQITTR